MRDLCHFFDFVLGSEGRLGILTEATVRIAPGNSLGPMKIRAATMRRAASA